MFHKCIGSSGSTDCSEENSKPRVMISGAIRLAFLSSLVIAIRCEANKINRRREERPMGLRAVKMFRDLRRRTHGHVAAANARRSESTYAQQVNMMSRIVAHNRLRDGSLENATCARGTDPAKISACRGKSRLFSRSSSVSRVHSVTRHEMMLISARCCAQSGPSPRAERCSVWPK